MSEHNEKKTKKEEVLCAQQHLPFLGGYVTDFEEMLRGVQTPVSRYNEPGSLKEKASLQLEKELLPFVSVSKNSTIVRDQRECYLPLKWKKIFDYLYKKNVIKEPFPRFDTTFNDDPKIIGLRLFGTSLEHITDGSPNPAGGGYSRGVSFDFEEALSKVVGEFLERYPLAIYREKNLFSGSIESLQKKKVAFLDPFLIRHFSEQQKKRFPRCDFSGSDMFRWVEGKSLFSSKKALIPAQLVFWNYRYASKEPTLQQPITNGAGGMFTVTEALLSALYELIQRDAFLVYWLNEIAPRRIDPKSLKREEADRISMLAERYGIETYILNITSDFGVPAVIAVLIDKSGNGPAVALGGGCGSDPEKAISGSITEALGVRCWLRERRQNRSYDLPADYEPFTTNITQEERLIYWGNVNMWKEIDFFLKGSMESMEKSFAHIQKINGSPQQELARLRKIFQEKENAAYEIFCYKAEHTILDVLGYASTRVIVPALMPLYFDERLAPLGNPRIREVCKSLGYKPVEKANPCPHPFP